MQSLCRVCVNCFIIISGYYGIRLKFKSLWNIFLTVVCVQLPFAVGMYFLHPGIDGIKVILKAFLGLSEHGYFVQCYVMLIFLSPLLNAFVEKYGRGMLWYIVTFVLIEGYFCLFRTDEIGFENGYRIVHFILLYLVARCLYLYKDELARVNSFWYLIIYFGGALIMTLLFLVGFTQIGSYSNPLTILMAIGLFVPFTQKVYNNRAINWIAGGTFTVFLINTTMPGSGLYIKLDNYLFDHYTIYQYYPLALGVAIILYMLSVLYDKVAKFVMKPFNEKVTVFVEHKFRNIILD